MFDVNIPTPEDILKAIKYCWQSLFDEIPSNKKISIIYTILHLRTTNFTFIKNWNFQNDSQKFNSLNDGIKNFLLTCNQNLMNIINSEQINLLLGFLDIKRLSFREYVLSIYKEAIYTLSNEYKVNRFVDTSK